jgi:transposase
MARAYSQDLRDRVIDAGTSARAAAERFGIGVATAIVRVRRAREGERRARRQGQPRRSKVDAHRDYLLGLIAAEPDLAIAEMQERLRSEAGVSASVGTISPVRSRPGPPRLHRRDVHLDQDGPTARLGAER